MSTYGDYRVTIGIECHVQLKTKTKLFSGADNDARDKAPNTTVSPLCFGLPGTLPVLNEQAIQLAIQAGLALNSEIAPLSRFERKHYFYPDLPLGYQITQLAEPIIGEGHVVCTLPDGSEKTVKIHHAHLEADAGKLTHPAGADYSLVDFNRAGTPLIEIVSEPDMHSPTEAKAFAQELYLLMTYADVSDGDLYHGNMRFDINVSVSKTDELGTRTETKNLNSFKSVEKAAEYEIHRQIALLDKGEAIVQETRGWDEAKQRTVTQRSKENAHDYRYFPDADLPPVRVLPQDVERTKQTMPQLPHFYRASWKVLNLDSTVVLALLSSRSLSELIQRLLDQSGPSVARRVALWYAALPQDQLQDMIARSSEHVNDTQFVELATMVDKSQINSSAAKEIFITMLQTGETPRTIAESKNLLQVSDENEIAALVDEIMNLPENKQSIDDLRAGNDRAIGFLVGQIMKKSQGKANPGLAQQLIRNRL